MRNRKMTGAEITGNTLGIIGLIALPIIIGITIYLSRRFKAASIGQARPDRGKGVPLDDAQRAARHYNISPEEYLDCPGCYPLPPRGAGLYG